MQGQIAVFVFLSALRRKASDAASSYARAKAVTGMGYKKRLERAFDGAPVLSLCAGKKYVLFSDCHRGDGTNNDNFLTKWQINARADGSIFVEHVHVACLRRWKTSE